MTIAITLADLIWQTSILFLALYSMCDMSGRVRLTCRLRPLYWPCVWVSAASGLLYFVLMVAQWLSPG